MKFLSITEWYKPGWMLGGMEGWIDAWMNGQMGQRKVNNEAGNTEWSRNKARESEIRRRSPGFLCLSSFRSIWEVWSTP